MSAVLERLTLKHAEFQSLWQKGSAWGILTTSVPPTSGARKSWQKSILIFGRKPTTGDPLTQIDDAFNTLAREYHDLKKQIDDTPSSSDDTPSSSSEDSQDEKDQFQPP